VVTSSRTAFDTSTTCNSIGADFLESPQEGDRTHDIAVEVETIISIACQHMSITTRIIVDRLATLSVTTWTTCWARSLLSP